jgi:HAD superfamily hydrolase (TIGR01509 family)
MSSERVSQHQAGQGPIIRPHAGRVKAVIFDMDGLLLDSERIAFAAFKFACARFNLGDQSKVFMQCVGTNQLAGERILYQEFRAIANVSEFLKVWDERYAAETSREPIPLKPGVTALLKRLAELEIPLAVATSTKTLRAKAKLEFSGILSHFSVVVGGDQVEKSKPAPEIYWHTAQMLGLDAPSCMVLEDSENGVRAGLAAGMFVIQIPDLIPPSAELLSMGAPVMQSLEDVLKQHFS